jgi:hypothetical protein
MTLRDIRRSLGEPEGPVGATTAKCTETAIVEVLL